MWCNHCDSICLNPVCVFGCVEREQDRKDLEVITKAIKAVQDGTNDPR